MGEAQEAPPPRALKGRRQGGKAHRKTSWGNWGKGRQGCWRERGRGRRKGKRNDRWEKSEKTDAKWDCIGSTLRLIKHHCDALCKLESTTQM